MKVNRRGRNEGRKEEEMKIGRKKKEMKIG